MKEMATTQLREMFEEAEETTLEARNEAERARDYVDGKQLTPAELEELRKRGQPPVIINRIRRKIEWLKGLEVKQRTDPRAFPRTPKHEAGAEAATDALRFIADNTEWDKRRSQVWDNMLTEGFGGVEVIHRQNRRGEVEIEVNHYPWDRLFYDPHSRRHDFSDARYLGAVVWMDKAEVLEEYPDKKAEIEAMSAEETGTETYDDRPRFGLWYDRRRSRIKVCLVWHKMGGKWYWCRFSRDIKLESGESPYVDQDGDSVCPLIMESAFVGRNNDRYGIVRDMFSPQDEINKRRSKALHAINTRQIIYSEGMVEDEAAMLREVAKPDGAIKIAADPEGRFEINTNGELAMGQFNLLQEAKMEIDLLGANSALEGEGGESQSGRAVLAKQQGGMIEIASLMDRLHDFTNRVYRAMWDRVRQFWNEERWVRVTDDERNVRFVGLNRPVTLQEKLGQLPPEQVQMAAQRLLLRPGDPRLEMVVDVENRVEEIEVDIIIEEVPDRVTLQGEAFEAALKYASAGSIPFEILLEYDPSLPASKKEQIKQKLEEMRQQQAQQPNPEAQKMQMEAQMDQARLQLEGQKAQAETQIKGQELQLDARKLQLEEAKLQIEMRKAEIEQRQTDMQISLQRDPAPLQPSPLEQQKMQLEARKLDLEFAKVQGEIDNLASPLIERLAAPIVADIQRMSAQVQELARQVQIANAPKQIVRDADGRPVGIAVEGGETRPIVRDESGQVAGIA
jgi:hypothetical protein